MNNNKNPIISFFQKEEKNVFVTLTKSDWWPIFNWIPELLGIIMDWIFKFLNMIGIPNVGLTIIILTIVLYLLMTPLQISQQRFTKLNSLITPEIKKIQEKYRGKRDTASQQAMTQEMQAVYGKYGVSQMGSCIQLLITLPIMFALYRVIYLVPGYISLIGEQLRTVAENSAFVEFFKNFATTTKDALLTNTLGNATTEKVMDAVYRLNTNQWKDILEAGKGQPFESALNGVHEYISNVTNFLGLNISDSPMNIIGNAWANGAILMIIVAILFPVLAWATQYFTLKLTASATNQDVPGSMQTMNKVMPIISAVFTFSLPTGIGIYLSIGAVVRAVQMIIINKRLDKESIEDIMKKAQEKENKKRAKRGLPPQKITNAAHVSTKSIEAAPAEHKESKAQQMQKRMKDSSNYYEENKAKGTGRIAQKANMVSLYNEKNEKKKK